MPDETARNSGEEARAELEKSLINEYLRSKGHTLESLKKLQKSESQKLMVEASIYASGKLTEIEDRSRYSQNIRDH